MPALAEKIQGIYKARSLPNEAEIKTLAAEVAKNPRPALDAALSLDDSSRNHLLRSISTNAQASGALLGEIAVEPDGAKRTVIVRSLMAQGAHIDVITTMVLQGKEPGMRMIETVNAAGGTPDQMADWIIGVGAVAALIGDATAPAISWADLERKLGNVNAANAIVARRVIANAQSKGFLTPAAFIGGLGTTTTRTLYFSSGGVLSWALQGLVAALKRGIDAAIYAIKGLLTLGQSLRNILEFVLNASAEALNFLIDAVRTFANGLWEIIAWVSDKSKEVFEKVVNYLTSGAGRFRDLLNAIFSAAIGSARDLLAKFLNKLREIGNKVALLIQDALDMASRIFMEIEKWLRTQAIPFVQNVVRWLFELGEVVAIGILVILGGLTYLIPAYAMAESQPMKYGSWKKLSDVPNVKSLDAGKKYVIFSDLHRGGTVERDFGLEKAHLNEQLYLKALDYYWNEGYTVIENGDAEDLWNLAPIVLAWHKNGQPPSRYSPLDALKGIINLHSATYRKLAQFHAAGRYVKVRGNHDSTIDKPELRGELARALNATSTNPLHIYDAVIIPPGSSSQAPTGTIGKLGDVVIGQIGKPRPILGGKLRGMLDKGIPPVLSTDPVNRVLVWHGHQVDFWNADEHNYLGQYLNGLSVFAQCHGWGVIAADETLPNGVQDYLLKLLPAMNKPQWIERIGDALKQKDTYRTGDALPGFNAVALTEVPMKELSNRFGVAMVMGHTHEAKVFLEPGMSGDSHLFGNSGTGGMWQGAVFCTEIAGNHMVVKYFADPDVLSALAPFDEQMAFA